MAELPGNGRHLAVAENDIEWIKTTLKDMKDEMERIEQRYMDTRRIMLLTVGPVGILTSLCLALIAIHFS